MAFWITLATGPFTLCETHMRVTLRVDMIIKDKGFFALFRIALTGAPQYNIDLFYHNTTLLSLTFSYLVHYLSIVTHFLKSKNPNSVSSLFAHSLTVESCSVFAQMVCNVFP